MTTIHLARHGQTTWHAENRYAGSSDVPLTARGREQAGALAAWADSLALAEVVSSPLQRAVDTAREVADVSGVTQTIDPRIREVDFGRGEGRTRDEMRELFPTELDRFLAAPATRPLPGGEAGRDAVDRFLQGIAELKSRWGERDEVLVVTHTTALRLALCALLGIPLDEYRRVFPSLGNVTVTTIRLAPGWSVSTPTEGVALLQFNAPLLH